MSFLKENKIFFTENLNEINMQFILILVKLNAKFNV